MSVLYWGWSATARCSPRLREAIQSQKSLPLKVFLYPEWRMDQSTVSHERMHLMTFMEVAKPNWYVPAIAIDSYTEFLKELDKGNIENVRAPAIAIDFKA
ncbi:ubiquinol oxidase 2, mitochondrial [Nicotiana attenuata]|uniref:Ubiquinol oxidase 2, mitochondrial n=1 Tax=Nicotiana attenuata TaxID=49451 RepID=A0A314KMU6_NICAT|nr:ubiquinol oxidase 2, mitochondrial [Nicotiana attenuata]